MTAVLCWRQASTGQSNLRKERNLTFLGQSNLRKALRLQRNPRKLRWLETKLRVSVATATLTASVQVVPPCSS